MRYVADSAGNILGCVKDDGSLHGVNDYNVMHSLGMLGDTNIDDTFGGKIFRWMHPDVEKEEYKGATDSQGNVLTVEPTTFGDVVDTGIQETTQRFSDAIDTGAPILKKLAIGAVIVVAGIAMIQGVSYLKMITPRRR